MYARSFNGPSSLLFLGRVWVQFFNCRQIRSRGNVVCRAGGDTVGADDDKRGGWEREREREKENENGAPGCDVVSCDFFSSFFDLLSFYRAVFVIHNFLLSWLYLGFF